MEVAMAEQFSRFEPAESLDSLDAIKVFMQDAFETGDAQHIAAALGDVVRARGVELLTEQTGFSGDDIRHSTSPSGEPSLKFILAVMKAVGLQVAVLPAAELAGHGAEFNATADARLAEYLATGESIAWSEMRCYLEARIRGKELALPSPRKLKR